MIRFQSLFAEAGAGDGGGGATTAAAVTTAATTETAATPESWHASILTADGKFSPGWQDKLPESMADHRPMLAQYGDFETFVKAHKDNMTTARAKTEGMVKVPGAKATPEEISAYHKALGVPETPDGYGIKAPEKMPDGVVWDEEHSKKFAEVAHKLGLTPSVVAALRDFQVTSTGEQAAAQRATIQKLMEAETAELKSLFGSKLDESVLSAQRVALSEGLPKDIFDPQHPDFWGPQALRFAANMAAKLGEGRLPSGPAVANLSPGLLATDIMTNPQNPEYAAYQNGDATVSVKVLELMRRATPAAA